MQADGIKISCAGRDRPASAAQATINGSTYSHTVSATSNRYTSIQVPGTAGPQTQAQGCYNAGRLTSDAYGSYNYSDRGRLASATRLGGTVNHRVNALQQRVSKSGPGSIVATGQAYCVLEVRLR